MNPVSYYATPRQVQDLAIQKHRTYQTHITFPDGLAELLIHGKLSTEAPPMPAFRENMTADEFDRFLLDIPFNIENIIQHAGRFHSDPNIDEAEIFPPGMDIFCFKHLPYMHEVPHTHEYFELTLLYQGTYRLLFENESLIMSEGDLCIIPPLSPHNQPLDPSCLAIGVCVRKSTFDDIFGNLLTQKDLVSTFFRNSLYGSMKANYLRMKTQLTPKIQNLIQLLVYESNQKDAYANMCSISLLNLFLIQILRKYSDTITFYNFEAYAQEDFDFALILQYIQQNYKTVTLSSLAKTFHFSEAYMSKFIQKHVNQNFVSLLRDLKMNKAQHYLTKTSMKISEISEQLGYGSVDHFSRTFKKYYGLSPSDYRKNIESKTAPPF